MLYVKCDPPSHIKSRMQRFSKQLGFHRHDPTSRPVLNPMHDCNPAVQKIPLVCVSA